MIQESDRMGAGSGDREIIYSKAIKAGKRIYYIDVKKNLRNDYFIAITESKKSLSGEGVPTYEKHKIFLYKEDFDKFIDGLTEIVDYIRILKDEENFPESESKRETDEKKADDNDDGIRLHIPFDPY
ncbi:MAG: PUR family DNA/RNA-binding protein [Tannerella sp.]|jgi:hypothetical protein|nr:PUR family DNA/RNA-binding protein [Tannerella sp.]